MKVFNKTLKKEIIDELQYLEDRYFTFDKPIPFITGLTLYPVSIENYNEFLVCSSCLTLNKNETAEGIVMSNLDFLIKKMEDEQVGQLYSRYFSRLMEIVFHIQNGVRCNKCNKIISFADFFKMLQEDKEHIKCPGCGSTDLEEVIRYNINPKTKKKELVIMGVHIDSKNFDRLRQIVMYQNLPDYKDDSWVNSEIREDQRLRNELITKNNGGPVFASLEKKIVCVSAKSSYKIEELFNMSIRKFIMLLTAIDDAMTYECDRLGRMSGLVSSPKPLEHWIYKHEASLYETAVDANEYTSKISAANGG